ncbi:MAG: PRD domain-containing protein [Erysipelotrichaceae bacterium]|nr:PRD domain-containing protein [Erysipelotrichaceae bacterium]
MIVNQVINNNTIFSTDELGNEVVCFGKGIGFHSKKGQTVDRGQIEKIFVVVDESEKNSFQNFVLEIPYEIITFGIRVTDYIEECCSKKINKKHLLLPLVDHLYTTLERYRDGIRIDNNVLWNIRYLYREEFKIAQDVVDMLISFTDVAIDEGEANYITLHIINSELDLDSRDGYKATSIIETAYKTVEETFDVVLDKEDISFQRFVTHLQFLAKRVIQNAFFEDDLDIYQNIRFKYADAYNCALKIINKLQNNYQITISESEISYLTIHIARLLKNTK